MNNLNYETRLINIMKENEITLSLAILFDMKNNEIDCDNVFEMTDYLEMELKDLDKVEFYMKVLTGIINDMELVSENKEK